MADYEIFREQLAIKYPSYGHALWGPSPRIPHRPVQVGDVGFIRRGNFHRLFNALLPADDPSHELGVPEYHEPLVPNLANHIYTDSLDRNNYCSAGVTVEPDPGYHARPGDFPQVTFQYRRTRGAAVLSLPVRARRQDTLSKGDFGRWIARHISSWFAFTRNLGLGIEHMEEIILVTGCDRSRSWTNVAFLGDQVDAQVSFGVKVEDHDTSINFQFLPENARGAVLRRGPEGVNLPENQCVFIRGYRVARSFWILPRHLKAAAGPSPDSGGYDNDPDTEILSMSENTKFRDPLHVLLDHIAASEQASDCDIVLAHDDDLETINGIGHGALPETPEPDVMTDFLRRSNIEIHKGFCDSSPTKSPNGPTADMAIVKVAMLSKTFQNWNTASPLSRPIELSNTGRGTRPPLVPSLLLILVPTIRGDRNASGGLAALSWKPLEYRPNKRPLAQRLHKRRPDEGQGTRNISQKNEASIKPPDAKKVKFAEDAPLQIGSGLKGGLSRLPLAREYGKSAKEALQFAKTVSDRAKYETLWLRLVGLNPTPTTGQLCAEMKPELTSFVEHLYHFNTSEMPESRRSNVKLAEMLLRDMNFIHPEAREGGKRHNPYRHPIIQEAVNVTLFRNKDDVGVVHHERFSPMPVPIIALILTVVQWCIEEWSDGQRRDSSWDEEKIQAVFTSHVSLLHSFQAQGLEGNVDVLHQLQWDLLKGAREHAEVPPYPVTEPRGSPRRKRLVGLTPAPTTGQLCAEMKPEVTTLVKRLYRFNARKASGSMRSNVKLAGVLLRDMNFIYPEARGDGKRHNPYRHPIIQEAVNVTLFRNKYDVGVVHHERFSPMPVPIIALILTVVQWCIEEWSDGRQSDSSWDVEKIQAVFTSHVSLLLSFQAQGLEKNTDVLRQLQWDLLKGAREHAGVPPYPITEPGVPLENVQL